MTTTVTVLPTGTRLVALEPVAVTFGYDGRGRRQVRYGGNVGRFHPMLKVNGVEISAHATFAEQQGEWKTTSGCYTRADFDRRDTTISWAARTKVHDWYAGQVLGLAEVHAAQFDAGLQTTAEDRSERWTSMAASLRQSADKCGRLAEFDTAIASGSAIVDRRPATIADWYDTRVRTDALVQGDLHGNGEVVAAVTIGSEVVGLGVSYRRNGQSAEVVWCPLEFVTV